MKKRRLSLYPFLAAAMPVLLFFNISAANEVTLDGLIVPLSIVLIICLVFYAVPALCVPADRPAIESRLALTFCVAWLIFNSPGICVLLSGLFITFGLPLDFFAWASKLLPLSWLLALLLLVLACREKFLPGAVKLSVATLRFLFVMQILCLAYATVNSILVARQAEVTVAAQIKPVLQADLRLKARQKDKMPDVYFILLDEMASTSVLKQYLGYDNSAELTGFRESGFFIAEQSMSCYPLTRLSLASTLNMVYLDSIAEVLGGKTSDWRVTAYMIRDSAVARAFQKGGYRYVHIDSRSAPFDYSFTADQNIDCGKTYPIMEPLIRFSILSLFPQTFAYLDDEARRHTLKELAALPNIAHSQAQSQTQIQTQTNNKPVFVFAHILCPHEPFIFGAAGEPTSNPGARDGKRWTAATNEAYVAQAKYIQLQTLATVKQIIAESSKAGRSPIIIVQGDHGTHSTDYISRVNPDPALLQERYGILNAVLVPDDIKAKLTDDIVSVNTFRVILRSLFDVDLPLLPARQVYATYAHPFKLSDVTDQVKAFRQRQQVGVTRN